MTHLFLLCKVNMLRLWREIPGFHSLIIVELPSHHVILLAEPDFLLPSLPGWTNVTEAELAFAPDLTEAGARSLQLLLCSSTRNESAVSEWHAHTVSRKRWCGETHEGRWKIDVNIRCHVTAHRIYTVWPGFVRITVDINGVSRIFIHRNLKYTEFKGL